MTESKNSKGQKVEEYSFEDWKQGNYPIDRNKAGYKKVLVSETNEIYFQYLPIEELKKIKAEQEKIYFLAVDGYFSMYCNQFKNLLIETGNDKDLIKLEIDFYNYVFFSAKREKLSLAIKPDMAVYGGYDVIYEQEFLKRKFDFSNIEFNEYPMLINSKARAAAFARAKYFHWLKSEYSENNRSEFLDPQKNVIEKNLSSLDIISEFSDPKKNVVPKNLQKKTSYEWQNEPDKELPELYSLMIDKYKLIAPETTEQQFTAVFTRQPIESINPIKWINSNRLLAYFLESVFSGQNWQSIAGNGKLFKNKTGNLITSNDLAVAKKNYLEYGKPKDYQNIDLIIKSIKKHSEH